MELGADVNNVDAHGCSALHYMAKRGSHEDILTCDMLLRYGADTGIRDVDRGTPLSYAAGLCTRAEDGYYKICWLCFHYGADFEISEKHLDSLLCLAAEEGDMQFCKKLLQAGAGIDTKNKDDNSTVTIALNHGKQETHNMLALHKAAAEYDFAKCKEMINEGADPNSVNKEGCTPLYWVCKGGDHELAKQLLRQEADPNVADKSGLTPLYFISREGDAELVKEFLKYGADASAAGCIHIALELYHTQAAEALICAGDVNKVDATCNKNKIN